MTFIKNEVLNQERSRVDHEGGFPGYGPVLDTPICHTDPHLDPHPTISWISFMNDP